MLRLSRTLLPAGDLLVCQRCKFFAARFHLDGDVLQRGAAEFQAGNLMMVGTFDVLQLAKGLLLKLVHAG